MGSALSTWASGFRVGLMACAIISCCAGAVAASPFKTLQLLPFQAYDADGRLVGSLILNGSTRVAVTVEGRRYAVPVTTVPSSIGLMEFDTSLTRWYMGPDCSGQAFVALAEQEVPWAFASVDKGRLLLFRTMGSIETVAYGSQKLPNTKCAKRKGAAQLAPLQDPVDITDRYRLPLHAR